MKALILAHRGRRGPKQPENSLAGLRALPRVDGVEIDVQRSKDGAYVLYHDAALPDGTPINALSAKALAQRKLSNGEPLPTLEAYLRAVPKGLVFLDLKETCAPVEVAELALRILPPERLFFSSFWHPGIRELGNRHPQLRRGVTLEARLVDPAAAMSGAGASVLVLPGSCVDLATVESVRRAGGEVWCWAARDPRSLEKIGVRGLIVD